MNRDRKQKFVEEQSSIAGAPIPCDLNCWSRLSHSSLAGQYSHFWEVPSTVSVHQCSVGTDWFQADASFFFFYQFVVVFQQGFKKIKPNIFRLIKISNENRSLIQQKDFFSECVTEEIHEPKLHGYWNYYPPTAAVRVWGASGLGSFYEACMALLCTFVGHKGAERKKDFPPNSADSTNWSCNCSKCLVFPTCFLLLPYLV